MKHLSQTGGSQGVTPFKGSQHQMHSHNIKTLFSLFLSQVHNVVFQKLYSVWYCNRLNIKVYVSILFSFPCFLSPSHLIQSKRVASVGLMLDPGALR